MNTDYPYLSSREALNAELAKLSASSENYVNPPAESACCYVPARPKRPQRFSYRCASCGKTVNLLISPCEFNYYEKGNEEEKTENDPVKVYQMIIESFAEFGCKAELSVYCAECSDETDPATGEKRVKYPRPVVIRFIFNDGKEPIVYYPASNRLDTRPFLLAYQFLSGKRSVSELSELNLFRGMDEQNSSENIVSEVFSVFLPDNKDLRIYRNYDNEENRAFINRFSALYDHRDESEDIS